MVLNVKHKTIKILENNIGENQDDLDYGKDLFSVTPRHDWQKK